MSLVDVIRSIVRPMIKAQILTGKVISVDITYSNTKTVTNMA